MPTRRPELNRALGCAILLAARAFAQFTSGVEGTVTDASQAAVPGAQAVLTNELTQVTHQVISSEAGFFRISDLPPGT